MTVKPADGRARFCAWAVFVSMAGTTMAFQVYHSVELGRMPWPLAVLYGVVPLCISMLLIEVVSGWDGAPKWTPAAAYLIIAGAMFLSAAATGAVVLRAAPPHSSLLFGVLLDGAAILAARFLMTAAKRTTAAEAAALESAARADRAALEEAAEAERAARRQAEAAAAEAVAKAEAEREAAQAEAARAVAKAEALTRQLAAAGNGQGGNGQGGNGGRKPPGDGNGTREQQAADGTEEVEGAPADLDSEARVLWYLDRGLSASRAGIKAGLTDSRGRQIARLRKPAPRGIDQGGSQ